MRKRLPRAVWGMTLLMGAIGGAAQGDAGVATQAGRAVDAARWAGTLAKLRSAEFGARAAGQKELDQATWRDREVLAGLAAGARDAEVKQRLAGRVEALDEAAAVNPPPISLDLKEASGPEAMVALGKALGIKVELAGESGERMSVHAVDRPFGEVFLEMSKSAGMASGIGGRVSFLPPGVPTGAGSGPFAIGPWRVRSTTAHAAGLAAPGGPPVRVMMLMYTAAVDPRVKLAQAPVVETKSILDEAGNELVPTSDPKPVGGAGVRGWVYTPVQRLEVGNGKKIVAVRGTAHFLVMVQEARLEVADMEKDFGTPVEVGGRVITFSNFSVEQAQVQFNVMSQPANGSPVRSAANQEGVKLTLIDATGKQVWETTIGISSGMSASVEGHLQGPIKGVFSRAIKVQTVDVPFEWKGLSLPLGGN